MKTRNVKSFLVASVITLAVSTLVVSVAQANKEKAAQFATPDENRPECADTPAELATMSDLVSLVDAFGGMANIAGTWKISGIPFVNDKISFNYDSTQFIVQTNDELPEQVSLCSSVNAKGIKMIRVAVHEPGCPENKNIYIRPDAKGRMLLTAYGTRAIGTAKFKKKSHTPLPAGKPKPAVKCVL